MLIALMLKLLLNIVFYLYIYIYIIIVKWLFKKYKINFDVITPFNTYFKLLNNVITLKIYLYIPFILITFTSLLFSISYTILSLLIKTL
jgi:hypothetical protein